MEVFQNAGKKPGLQVWRVEKMDLKEVPREYYGDFCNGDAYILLNTTSAPSYNVHSWLGCEATQDERGAAAIFMMQLDDYLKGKPVQYTEFQNEESPTFMSYFKNGIRYEKGGVASGFKYVVTNDVSDVKRALQVKGRRYIRATEVDFSWDSFNSGDCFIIDLGNNIYHWSGCKSNRFERLKSTLVAKDIRDNERRGRAEVHMINEGEEPSEVTDALGKKPDLPSGSPDVVVQQVSKRAKSEASLYMISDAAGSMKETLVAKRNPFKQDMLRPGECFILDNGGDHTIYVWKGSDANIDERKAALKAAEQFIKHHNYSSNTKVVVVPAKAEPTLFKEFFFSWMDKDETTGFGESHTVGTIAKVKKIPFDVSSLHSNKAMAAQHGMVDDGSGKVEIWRVDGATRELDPVDPSTYGQFYGGDCYLLQYSYNCDGQTKYIIYTWQGNKCSQDELVLSAYLTTQLDDSMGGAATQVRVTQGQEPPHLVSVCKGKLVIVYLGGTCRVGGQSAAGNIRLFHIRISSTKATRAVEVEPTASSLNTNDVFVLKTPNGVTVWKGEGAVEEEMEAAQYLAGLLKGSVTEVKEKREPDAFWAALGGKAAYQTSRTLKNPMKPPRLFGCSNKTGNLIVEEVPGDWTQTDLATDDIMILDSGDQIYVWVGKDANVEEKKGVCNIAKEYINTDPSGRSGNPITIVKQGDEPPSFTGWFQAWDPKAWDNLDDLMRRFS